MSANGLVTFWLDDCCYGIDVLDVQEVLAPHGLTRVPGSPDAVLGLMNLRGLIITAVDLRQRMGLAPLTDPTTATSIVVRSDDAPVSLLVDRIGDVVEVENMPFEAPPDTLTGPARDLITGAYKLDDLLLLELDTSRAITDLTAAAV